MRRPRHPVSEELQGLAFNPASFLYEISEEGILYGLTLELTRMLKAYSRAAGRSAVNEPLVASWYKSLDKHTKKIVIRAGKIATHSQDFIPILNLIKNDTFLWKLKPLHRRA